MSSRKITTLESLTAIAQQWRDAGKRLVLCHGTFDLMHAGHIKHLQRARQEGDLLIVTVTADAYVNKGPGRPVFPQTIRADSLAALSCVDYVAINSAETALNVIAALRPDIYVKGGEYQDEAADVTGNIRREREAVEAVGGAIFFTHEETFSSTQLLNNFFGIFTEETKSYLATMRDAVSAETLIEQLNQLRSLRVLVVGDTIVDEYCYTSPLGQSGKGNVLAVRYQDEERFAGGAVAVANHLAGFSDAVTLLSVLGSQNSYQDFIQSKLQASVTPHFFMRDDDQTLVKRRFVDPDMAKLFEVYLYSGHPLPTAVEAQLLAWLEASAADFDLVVVPDFGNGMITPAMVAALGKQARFLAVNAQINAGNRCYHAVTRYPRADFLSLNEPELRLAMHNASGSLDDLAATLGQRMGAQGVAVTRGTKGVLLHEVSGAQQHEVPALSTRVIDRIGAGDAFLSLAALTLAGGLGGSVAAFIGSVAAALEVQTVCNREPVAPVQLFKYLKTLLK
ncbi:MAG: adenylyltransferase/cytidyltransferase family protein [Gammaproteobacteria bacterium]|nr:adenylyltransferase/cytidyltransferase family protein [Gammaproteobacteria bacterium]